MKNHVKIYLEFFGFDGHEYIECEVCQKARAVDIHHIEARGMGGSKHADHILNLQGVCRACHIEYGDKKQHKDMLRTKHIDYMLKHERAKTEALLSEKYN